MSTEMDSLSEMFGDDEDASIDARFQHLKHFFRGYRDFVNGASPFTSPYSPGGARNRSWKMGACLAHNDWVKKKE